MQAQHHEPPTLTFRTALSPRRLRQLLAACLLVDALCAGVYALMGGANTAWILAALALPLAGALLLVLRGRSREAAVLMLTGIVLGLGYLSVRSMGLRDETIIAFPGILMFASAFSTRRAFFLTVALVMGTVLFIGLGDVQGWFPHPVERISYASILTIESILAVVTFVTWAMARDLRSAMKRLAAENERMRESHARIDALAHHDALTGLPNRLAARDRLKKAIARAEENAQSVALVYLDLDNFKAINDSIGHGAGDQLLREVAHRLGTTVRAGDTISRQGGDEFLLVLGELTSEEVAANSAVRIIHELGQPFRINGLELFLTASIGIALYPRDGQDFDTLAKNADVAMYRAKDAGRNAFRFYDAEMNTSVIETLHLISGIRGAVARDEFQLHYQPQFNLRTGALIGAEALIRWRHPELGLIPPGKFIPVAERSGLINEVGAWVLNEACRQARQWQEDGLRSLVVGVNLSPVQFRRDDIEREVLNALSASGLAPDCLELELTESLLIADSTHLTALLGRLRNLGVRFSIDDFGTGYSNLGYLKRFEVERLKIDQSFVRRLTTDSNDEGIVRAIIEMAHSLKLDAVAEGVETQETLDHLIRLQCDFGQGYHWSPALPAEEFFALAMRRRAAEAAAAAASASGHLTLVR